MACDAIPRLCALSDGCSLISLMLDFKSLAQSCDAAVSGGLRHDMLAVAEELSQSSADADEDNAARRAASGLDGYLGADRDAVYTSVRREHTRLFDDPDRPAVPYYEGAFVNRMFASQGKEAPDVSSLFINQAAMDADRQYKRAGARKPADENVPGDSMFVEMAFLGMLLGARASELAGPSREPDRRAGGAGGAGSADGGRPRGLPPLALTTSDMIDEFLHLHVRPWARAFFSELGEKAREPYFAALAGFGLSLVDELERCRPQAFDGRRIA